MLIWSTLLACDVRLFPCLPWRESYYGSMWIRLVSGNRDPACWGFIWGIVTHRGRLMYHKQTLILGIKTELNKCTLHFLSNKTISITSSDRCDTVWNFSWPLSQGAESSYSVDLTSSQPVLCVMQLSWWPAFQLPDGERPVTKKQHLWQQVISWLGFCKK